MATIVEQLIGFQVIREINRAEKSTLHIAGLLKTAPDDLEADTVKAAATASLASTQKKMDAVKEFCDNYPGGSAALTRAYQAFGVTPKQVADGIDNLRSISVTTREALAVAESGKDSAVTIGNQAHDAIEENVTEIMDPEEHFEMIQMHCACWDLVNVIAISLQGINHGTGAVLEPDSVDIRKKMVQMHMKTFGRASAYLDDSREAIDMLDAFWIVKEEIDGCKELEQLRKLGTQIDMLVPRIPLIRRRWQYGQTVRNNPR